MNKVNLLLVAAAIATGNLAAQSSHAVSVNGKVAINSKFVVK